MRLYLNQKGRGKTVAERAFTLVEAITAAVVVAITYAAVFSGVSTTFRLLQTTRENLRATQIIVSRMEGLRLCAWGNDQLFNTNIVPTTFTNYFYPLGLKGSTNQGTTYYGTMQITTPATFVGTAPSYATNMASVNVTVTWTDAAYGVTNVHTRSMSTYVSEYGLQNYVYSSN